MKERELLTLTEEMFNKANEALTKMLVESGVTLETVLNMDSEEMEALKTFFELWNVCEEYSLEMAKRLDKINDIDEKLDMVVKQLRDKK